MYYKVVHSFKKQESTVVHFIEFEFFWYHGFNGNKVRVSKSIKKKKTMLGIYENMAQF
jgi:hypothetical protein